MRISAGASHAAVALAVLVSVACGGEAEAPAPQPTTGSVGADGSVDPALLEPLTGLGPCQSPPEAQAEAADVDGLVLPPTGVVTELTAGDPLTQVRGYIQRTPVEIRVFYADGSAGVDVITIEDEVREAEVLMTDGSRRTFIKAQAVCERGSFFVAFVAPAGDAELLPEPALGGN